MKRVKTVPDTKKEATHTLSAELSEMNSSSLHVQFTSLFVSGTFIKNSLNYLFRFLSISAFLFSTCWSFFLSLHF